MQTDNSLSSCLLALRKSFAFTLAEVLITLGIIGIVAAMTMPSLIAKHQKKVIATSLKANYSIFSQVIENSKRDNGDIDTWPDRSSMSRLDFEKQYILPYLNNPKETEGHVVYAMQKSPSKNSQQSLYWFYNSSGYFYQLSNGAVFTTGIYSLGDNRYIAVDVNGKKGPNIMGKDVFLFNIGIRSYYSNKKNKFSPGTNGRGQTVEELTEDSCQYSNWGNCNFCEGNVYAGAACAAVIALENWEITENYPW